MAFNFSKGYGPLYFENATRFNATAPYNPNILSAFNNWVLENRPKPMPIPTPPGSPPPSPGVQMHIPVIGQEIAPPQNYGNEPPPPGLEDEQENDDGFGEVEDLGPEPLHHQGWQQQPFHMQPPPVALHPVHIPPPPLPWQHAQQQFVAQNPVAQARPIPLNRIQAYWDRTYPDMFRLVAFDVGRQCFIKKIKIRPQLPHYRIVAYDLETTRVNGEHQPNLVSAAVSCSVCSGEEKECEICEEGPKMMTWAKFLKERHIPIIPEGGKAMELGYRVVWFYRAYHFEEFDSPKQYSLKLRQKSDGLVWHKTKIRGMTLNMDNELTYEDFKRMVLEYKEGQKKQFRYPEKIGPNKDSRILSKDVTKDYGPIQKKGIIDDNLNVLPFGFY
uniref:Exonuclease domain-containing protein n=1 Tax=Globodera pallida TaxID=36090 RepID=A0A183BUU7_GLOPA